MIGIESLNILEFDKVLNAVCNFAHSSVSQDIIREIRPLSERKTIEERFGHVEEIRLLEQKGTPLRLSHFDDISGMITKIKPEDALLETREILDLASVLRIISTLSGQIRVTEGFPGLTELAGNLSGFPDLLHAIEKSIDLDGNILDSASPALSQLRRRRKAVEAIIRKRLEEIVRNSSVLPFLQDDFITQRSGRWVIPVRMDSKGQIPGVVHDISRSGETAFTEPLEIIGTANELENIVAEERAEEIRILKAICRMIRRVTNEIEDQYKTLLYFDVLNSVAQFADALRMEVPKLNESSEVRLINARHPLLMLLREKHGVENVVPLDLSLGTENKVMVISGPNAGGKTVAIKTLGLLLLMALSGIPVPAHSDSTFPLMGALLVDLGDEQSIEESLSTFSAHISNICDILKKADSNTLVLIDELGTGTDPAQGAALACAILKDLNHKGSLVVATTHLAEILGFVYRMEGMINASMEIDQNTLTPLYKLQTGEPGQSHALEIARKYGLPEHIVQDAKELLGNSKMDWQDLMAELNEKKVMHETALRKLEEERSAITARETLLKEKLKDTERQHQETLEKAYGQAAEIVSEIKRQVYAVLDDAKKERSHDSMRRIVRVQREVGEKLAEFHKEPSLSIKEIKEGQIVFVKSIGYDASVIKIDMRHERLRLKSGLMEWEVPISDVGPKRGKSPDNIRVQNKRMEQEETSSKLNLIGLRVDEAVSKLDSYLDRAFRSGVNEISIIHGTGTGALQKAIRKHLGTHPLVREFRKGEPSEGGDGITLANLESM